MTATQYFWRHPLAEQVREGTDLNRLEAWAQRAMHVKDASELFDGE
ncbi:hypothetical protein [Streptomyces sp. DSM 118148]